MHDETVPRLLEPPDRSFFLFGPRGVGKSTWLKRVLPGAVHLDLLDASLFLELTRDPHRVEALVGPKPAGTWVVIDEIQKAPPLLEEAHRLMEDRRWKFALCGSSARKLRRGGVNLLGGRAWPYALFPMTCRELGKDFDLPAALRFGTLPPVIGRPEAYCSRFLKAYAQTYLKEEILQEALVRNVPAFSRFLELAADQSGGLVNYSNFAAETGVADGSCRANSGAG